VSGFFGGQEGVAKNAGQMATDKRLGGFFLRGGGCGWMGGCQMSQVSCAIILRVCGA